MTERERSDPTDEPGDEVFQHHMPGNTCFGCGQENERGLRLESRWRGDVAVATFHPRPEHAAGRADVLNGGIIATIIDCHSIGTAIADAYRREGRPMGTGETIRYVTARLTVSYHAPTPTDSPVELEARVVAVDGRKTTVAVDLMSRGQRCASGEVLAVRVP